MSEEKAQATDPSWFKEHLSFLNKGMRNARKDNFLNLISINCNNPKVLLSTIDIPITPAHKVDDATFHTFL